MRFVRGATQRPCAMVATSAASCESVSASPVSSSEIRQPVAVLPGPSESVPFETAHTPRSVIRFAT
jgi:hypothetical protein